MTQKNNMAQKPLIINQWQNGMADSPNAGIGLIRNASIDVESGALMPNFAPTKISPTASSAAVTFVAATDIGTVGTSFPALTNNVAVTFTSTGTLPAPLVAGTVYNIIAVSGTTFKLAASIKDVGSISGFSQVVIDITTTGSGVHTMSTVNVGLISSTCTLYDPSNTLFDGTPRKVIFYADSNGFVWFYDPLNVPGQLCYLPGNSLTLPTGRGIAAFVTSSINSQYLFVPRFNGMDVCSIGSTTSLYNPIGSSAWTNAWQGLSKSPASQMMVVGDDNIIYFCNGRCVGSIQEIPTKVFSPTDSTTYTFNEAALTLPQGESAAWLEQLGINLLVAGIAKNKIYPWDRSSPSFNLPIYCAESGVYRLKNIDNTIYILNGVRGNIYKTQGAIVVPVRKLPEYILGNGSANVSWGGISSKSGNLLFGVTANNNSANSGTYMMYPDGRIVIDNQPSTGAAGVTAIDESTTEFYTFGYNGGVDLVSTARRTSFGTVAQSALYTIATKDIKATFSQMEVQLNRPTSGSSSQIRVSYRTSISGSFTVLATFTTDGVSTSFNTDIGLTNIENIQIQVEMTGAGNNDDQLQLITVTLTP